MIATVTFRRKTFRVQAVQVTVEDLKELAEWCGGSVKIETSGPHGGLGDPYIEVPIGRIAGRTKYAHAKVGDWITRLSTANNFRVYHDRSFKEAFEEIAVDMEKYAEIHQIVVNAMRKQDAATYNGESSRGMDEVADKATRSILGLL